MTATLVSPSAWDGRDMTGPQLRALCNICPTTLWRDEHERFFIRGIRRGGVKPRIYPAKEIRRYLKTKHPHLLPAA